jgi:hypothetical protein
MAKDFDNLVGTWDSVQRRLKDYLNGNEWEEFAGVSNFRLLKDGWAHFDEVEFPSVGTAGLTIRLFDPAREEWSIYWASSRNGQLGLPPVVGKFDPDGVGRFYSEEQWEGHDIICRYQWSDITETTARWEQAFSLDGGQTWKPNWTAEFSKRS